MSKKNYKKYPRHLMIPDTQIQRGSCLNHLNALGNYIVEKQFEHWIQIGDWADMHSLSSYDQGKKAGEGARVMLDIAAANYGLKVLEDPIDKYNSTRRSFRKKQYTPTKDFTEGNHEQRMRRHINSYPVLDGMLSLRDLDFERRGWAVHDFLEIHERDSILYSHYFPRNAQGRIVQTHRGAPNARLQVQREMQSCTSGHLQGLDFHVQQTGKRRYYGIIAGSFYLDDFDYLSPQGEAYWRGVIVKNEVRDGEYDPMFISIDYLLRKYWDGKQYYAE